MDELQVVLISTALATLFVVTLWADPK